MKIDGRCHCGALTYEAEIDPAQVWICHCTDCQTLSGTAFRSVVAAESAGFRLLTGTPRHYVKTAESGNRRLQAFCPDCGTPLYARPADDPDGPLSLRLGSVRQRAELVPRRQFWTRSAQPWAGDLSGIAREETE